MLIKENLTFHNLVRLIIVLCGLLTLSLSASAFFGPQVNFAAWFQKQTLYYPMSYTSAFCFALLGLTLIFTFFRWIYLTRVLAIIVFVEAVTALFSVVFDAKWFAVCSILSIDNCLAAPGYLRTSILTSTCFILFAIAFWKNVYPKTLGKNSIFFMGVIGVLTLGFSILSLLGYVVRGGGDMPIDPMYLKLGMAANTAVVTFILATGTTLLAGEFRHQAGLDLKHFMPPLSAIFIALVSLLFWRFLLRNESFVHLPIKVAFYTVIKEFVIAIMMGFVIYFAQTAYALAKKARRMAALAKAILEGVPEGLFVVNTKGRIVGSNQRLLQMWDIPQSLEKESNFTTINDYVKTQVSNPEVFEGAVHNMMFETNALMRGEVMLKNGNVYEFSTYPESLDGQIIGQVCSFHDITHLKQTENKLTYFATHDDLTGLANRYFLLEIISKAIAHAKRNHALLALLFFDLNRFKQVNDSLGHAAGDALLKEVASRLQNCTRSEDTLARIGGDEFVLLVTNIIDLDNVVIIANRFLSELSKPFSIDNHVLYLDCSLGISVYPKDGLKPEVLLKNADIAMYDAKKKKLRFRFYEETLEVKIINRLTLENELRLGLSETRFVLHYQPIIDLKSGTLVASEALIRWRHPTHGLIMPVDFISVAEDSNLIQEIGEWSLREACRQNQIWQNSPLKNLKVSVNVSPLQLRNPKFADKVEEILRETGLDPNLLELEFTESVFIEDFMQMKSVYHRLRKMGVGFALDDFGTGYSSLNYLRNIPLDTLKVDKSFVDDVAAAEEARAIVVAILALAKSLRLGVVAEGVEHLSQALFLKENGCDMVQGFYFSKPISVVEYEESLDSIKSKAAQLAHSPEA